MGRPRIDYTQSLIRKGALRRRLTDHFTDFLTGIARRIADSVPAGTEIQAGGYTWAVMRVRSRLDAANFLIVAHEDGRRRAIDGEPDRTFNLHGDFQIEIKTAGRAEYLAFANNMTEIIKAFELAEEKYVAEILDSLNDLRKKLEVS